MKNIEARKIEIATIHHIDGAGFGNEVVQDVDVVNMALGGCAAERITSSP